MTFRCLDSDIGSSSPEVTRVFTVPPSPFTEITANVTHVQAGHILTLRIAVNAIRSFYNLSPMMWGEEIVAGKTAVKSWPFHIAELRRAIEPVITMINDFDASTAFNIPSFTWIPIGTGRPKAAVMGQLQELMLAL